MPMPHFSHRTVRTELVYGSCKYLISLRQKLLFRLKKADKPVGFLYFYLTH
jgi:hypothetical protein